MYDAKGLGFIMVFFPSMLVAALVTIALLALGWDNAAWWVLGIGFVVAVFLGREMERNT